MFNRDDPQLTTLPLNKAVSFTFSLMASHWPIYNCLPTAKEPAPSIPVNDRLFLCSITSRDSKFVVTVNTGWEDMCSVCSTHNCLPLKENWTPNLHYMAPKDCEGYIPNSLTMERNVHFSFEILYDTVLLGHVLHLCLDSHPSCPRGSSVTHHMKLPLCCVPISLEIKNLHLGGGVIRIQDVQRGGETFHPTIQVLKEVLETDQAH